ncbi:MAG: hypothetical protein A4E66_00673 [Syntrophus sp. PtaB.Bin001]|nr:MAG: hypothetical protein A4E66_00673 [Syntrophus sp. PtaB.Bin001]
MEKRITMIGIKRPGKPWLIRFADQKNKVVGCILPDRKLSSHKKEN